MENRTLDDTAAAAAAAAAVAKAAECVEIITAKTFPGDAQGFGINNCFTISEFGTCASFRSNVVSMLSMPKDKWSNIAGLARKVAQDEVADQSSALNLSTVVQKLTMKTMFMPLFDRDTHSPEHDSNIRDLAESINQQ
ncbi:hypothetical protein B0A50_05503 [Salinomyces thailandicus]|uniref:Uncharacterized protein n=1 Tax=Salinomyces thailandicus TaxID=706561 RepID=A0A4U0TUJ7_9PEZI|nr:hypothetical protein B0A50_05503 [Salinomyces thailandica]